MELVLGLATIATAISGVANAGQFSNSGETIAETDKIVQTTNETIHIADATEYEGLAEPVLSNYSGSLFEGRLGGHTFPGEPSERAFYDEVENNDTVKKAQDIGHYMERHSNWDLTHYSATGRPEIDPVEIHGNIKNEKDVDWYTFTLYGKTELNIQLSRMALECNYDIALYKKTNVPKAGENDVTEIASSTQRLNRNEKIERRVNAGVYYIKVYAAGGYGATKYYLSCNAYYVRDDASINQMQEMGAKGALWYADYDPFGIKPTTSLDSWVVGTNCTSAYLWKNEASYHPEFDFEYDEPYKQAELFVWDHDLRMQLYSAAEQLLSQAEAKHTDAVNLHIQHQIDQSLQSIVLTLLSEAAGKEFSYIISGLTICQEIWCMLFPEGDLFEHYNDVKSYFRTLKAALECNDDTGEYEIVRIPIRYTIKQDEYRDDFSLALLGYLSTVNDRLFSYEPTKPEEDQYLYDDGGKTHEQERFIHYVDWEGQSPFTGTIYPLLDDNSTNMAWNRQSFDLSFNTLNVNDQTTLSLESGEYEWYKFTAPHDGTFYFASEGDDGATLDVFDHMVYGKSDYSRILRTYHTINEYTGFSYSTYMNAGENKYFRVSGGCGHYWSLQTTLIKASDSNLFDYVSLEADEFNLGTTWSNHWAYSSITSPENVSIEALGTFYNEEYGFVEMKADKNDICQRAIFTLFFDRPIKSFTFGSCIANSYSYASLGLQVYGLDEDGDTAVIDVISSYTNDDLYSYDIQYKTPERDVGHDIYGISFHLDPDTDQSPYHVSYQRQWLGAFLIDFAD